MKEKSKRLSEEQIDEIVVAQTEDDSAWTKPAKVRRTKSTSVALPSELAARAAFFARGKHEPVCQSMEK